MKNFGTHFPCDDCGTLADDHAKTETGGGICDDCDFKRGAAFFNANGKLTGVENYAFKQGFEEAKGMAVNSLLGSIRELQPALSSVVVGFGVLAAIAFVLGFASGVAQ